MAPDLIKAGKDCATIVLEGFAQSRRADSSGQADSENTTDRGSRDEIEDLGERFLRLFFELLQKCSRVKPPAFLLQRGTRFGMVELR